MRRSRSYTENRTETLSCEIVCSSERTESENARHEGAENPTQIDRRIRRTLNGIHAGIGSGSQIGASRL
jgi:hypothetical protein